jgi:hypothetical protein
MTTVEGTITFPLLQNLSVDPIPFEFVAPTFAAL